MKKVSQFIIILISLFYIDHVFAKEEYTFSYTGNYQSFVVPKDGFYQVELWGAQGGNHNNNPHTGGNGAYTSGVIFLEKNQTFYVYVGAKSQSVANGTSFNGGTASGSGFPGGGATDIRYFGENYTPTNSDLIWSSALGLKSRIMVAAGGGSAIGSTSQAGAGGGLTGLPGGANNPGTQTSGGASNGGYGLGAFGISGGGCSGGGGYYGGGGSLCANGAGGGSSFISGHKGCNAITSSTNLTPTNQSIHYSNLSFIDTVMIDGTGFLWKEEVTDELVGMPTFDGTSTMLGNTSNGYAKITYLENYSIVKSISIQDYVAVKNADDFTFFINENEITGNLVVETYTEPLLIVGINNVTLTVGSTHQFSVIDKDGKLSIYNINVESKRPNVSITFPNIDFEFNKNQNDYTLPIVPYNTKKLTPIVQVPSGVTYEIVNDNLYVGENTIKVIVNYDSQQIEYRFLVTREKFLGVVKEFKATNTYHEYEVPQTGAYQIELWGGAGMGTGYGGYTKGTIQLVKGMKLYFYVGNKRTTSGQNTIFNNGTGSSQGWNGGGSTDVRYFGENYTPTSSDLLWSSDLGINSRIMVAGAGGSGSSGVNAGAAGGLTGYKATNGTNGGTQTNAGSSTYVASSFGHAKGGCTGGNGYYPGGGAACASGSGGGSSFISGHDGCNAITSSTNLTPTNQSVHYSGLFFTDTVMIDGKGYEWKASIQAPMAMPNPKGGDFASGKGNDDDGFARITPMSEGSNNNALLQSLTLNNGDIAIPFDPNTHTYETIELTENDNKISVEAIPQDMNAEVIGNGVYDLLVGDNEIVITVTSSGGHSETYTIPIYRPASIESKIEGIYINGEKHDLPEKNANGKYVFNVSYLLDFAHVAVIKGQENQEVSGEGIKVFEGDQVEFSLLVQSEDHEHNSYYEIVIEKEKTNLLKAIHLPDLAEDIPFSNEVLEYTIEIPLTLHSLNIDAIPYYNGTTVTILNNEYIGENNRDITIISSLEGFTDVTYHIHIDFIKDIEGEPSYFPYTGSIQEFIVPVTGYYDIELWGGSGKGSAYGAYTKGKIYLEKDTILYFYIGGAHTPYGDNMVFNNGRGSSGGWNGGGATDVRLVNGTWTDFNSLKSRIMVAGAGGTASNTTFAGAAGGLVGYDGKGTKGGSQTTFGARQSSGYTTSSFGIANGGCTGGNGYYPGGGASCASGSGGGSSFISGHNGSNAIAEESTVNNIIHTNQSIHYSNLFFIDTVMIDGLGYNWTDKKEEQTLMPNPNGGYFASGTGNNGNGYAKIKPSELISNDNYLDSITIKDKEGNNVSFNFEPWIEEYTIPLNKTQTIVNIQATPKDLLATIDGLGDFEVPPSTWEEEKTKVIKVTAQDGSTREYKITFEREPDSDSYPKTIEVNRMTLSLCLKNRDYCNYTWNASTTNYNITLPFNIKEVEVKPILKSKYQTVQYYLLDGEEEILLENLDSNIFSTISRLDLKIVILSEDMTHESIYTYHIERDPRGNNNLESITITNPSITVENFDPYTYEYYLTLPNDYSSYDVEAIPEVREAEVSVRGNTELNTPGIHDCIITVKALNEEEKTYIIHMYKEYVANVFMRDFKVLYEGQELEITPTYDKRINEYNLSVDSNVSEITLTGEKEDGTATIVGLGTKQLVKGINTFTITITSTTGVINTYTLTVYKSMSSNALIKNLSVDGYELNPKFDSNTTEYTIYLNKGVTSVNVNVEMVEPDKASYTIRNNTNLTKSVNEIIITGIAEDKTYKVYKIYAMKETSDNAFLRMIYLNNEVLEDFDKETTTYTLEVGPDISKMNVYGVLDDDSAILTGNGTYSLEKGLNTITLNVTAENGNTKDYTLKITRKKSSDVLLKQVNSSQGEIEEKKTSDYDYFINVQYEVNSITLEGIPNVSTSTVSGNKTYPLETGDNTFVLKVTAEDGSEATYKVRVVRDMSLNDDLLFLYVHEGALKPNFSETNIFYDVVVPENIRSVRDLTIEAIPEDPNASYEILYPQDESLEIGGPKEIIVRVYAEKYEESKEKYKDYTLVVTRQNAYSDNLSLENILINDQDLEGFNPDTLDYTLTVTNDITSIKVEGIPFVTEGVKVLGNGTYNLKVGKNLISIIIQKEIQIDGNDVLVEKAYQIVVEREKSSDATLQTLMIKGHTLSPSFNKNTESYTLTTSATELDFTSIIPTEAEAKYKVEGNKNFTTGENRITITVTAPDGHTTKEYTITVTKEGSKNNNLSFLEVEGYTLTPNFHKGVTFYTVEVENSVNTIVINATAEESTSTITGTGLQTISSGENYFTITVTSEENTTKTYTILVTKDKSDNNYLASLVPSDGVLKYLDDGITKEGFLKTINNYTLEVDYETTNLSFTGLPEQMNAIVSGLNERTLNVGENTITITVTSESGKINTYTVTVTRNPLISAYLKDLKVEDYDFDVPFNKETFNYYLAVDYEVSKYSLLKMTYELEDETATSKVIVNGVELSDDADLNLGMNEIHIIVTSVNDEEQEYILYVNRQMSTNNYLSSLYVNEGTISPEFDKETLSYSVTVSNTTSEITITAEKEDTSARITEGVGVHSLDYGSNEINIRVRSAIGIIRTYKVEVIREKSSNNKLLDLKAKNIEGTTLTPKEAFNSERNTLEYELTSALSYVNIEAIKGDNFQTVSGTGIKELHEGKNEFTITVTSQDDNVFTYTLTITNPKDNNANASLIIPSVGTLSPKFKSETEEYSLYVEDATSLYFTVTTESDKATVSGHTIENVPEGESERIITITAEDDTTKEYKIKVIRTSVSEARLESLTLDGYEFEFDPDTFTYNIQVSRSKKEITMNKVLEDNSIYNEIKAIPKDENATVNMMGTLTLNEGMINIYTVEVIAVDGFTTQEYTLNITRDSTTYSLMSDVYDINRNDTEDYVIGILPSTSDEVFKGNFTNESTMLHVYKETTELEDGKLVATEMIIKLESEDYVYDTARIIVRGDLTKDGKVDITDQVKLINYVGKAITFNRSEMLAGDLTFDGRVDITDQVKLINYVGKAITSINPIKVTSE